MPKFVVHNFGCRASQADGAAIETMLARSGHAAAEDSHDADVVVLNTCTVTDTADDRSPSDRTAGASRESGRANRGDRLLCAAGSG